jgi:hypothetical protein
MNPKEWSEKIKKLRERLAVCLLRKSVDQSNEKLTEWFKMIEAIGKRDTICPLMMLKEPGRFKPEICICDIPKTRAHFLMTETICHSNLKCLPRGILLDEASKELNPRPRYIQKSTHF